MFPSFLHPPRYIANHPTSITAMNLKACIHYQLYNGKAAEVELKDLQNAAMGDVYHEHDILRHNICVFRNGDNALQVLPPLYDVIPEARLNLVIYYMRTENPQEAWNLIQDLEPQVPREYILKGVVAAALGQSLNGSAEHLKMAQQLFQLVGASSSECDTIPGRQCMSMCFMLLRQYEDVLVYLKSIKAYFPNDDDFNWNYGLACTHIRPFSLFWLTQKRGKKRVFPFLHEAPVPRITKRRSRPS